MVCGFRQLNHLWKKFAIILETLTLFGTDFKTLNLSNINHKARLFTPRLAKTVTIYIEHVH